jgi:hypothetical protein
MPSEQRSMSNSVEIQVRTVLVNPPSAAGVTANREGSGGLGTETQGSEGFVYPPQTMALAAASLQRAGLEVAALDAVGEAMSVEAALIRLGQLLRIDDAVRLSRPAEVSEEVEASDQETAPVSPARGETARVLGMVISAATLDHDLQFATALTQTWPDVPLFFFGNAGRHVWRQALERSEAELVMLYDVEKAVPAVAKALSLGTPETLALLEGVATREDGEFHVRPATSQSRELRGLPFPAWEMLPVERYPFLTLTASTGCNHACAYCPYVSAQGPWRSRPAEEVAAEARWLSRTFRKPRLIFRDPAFAADRDQTIALCRALRRAWVRTPWECESRPEHFDAGLLNQLKRSGCHTIKLGLETVDDMVLWGTNRILDGWTPARYRAHVAELVAACRRLGLNCRVFVMTGLPGETAQGLESTLAFLRAIRPPAVSVKRYQPYPGTRLGAGGETTVGYLQPGEELLLRFEAGARATASPLVPRRRGLWRRIVGS